MPAQILFIFLSLTSSQARKKRNPTAAFTELDNRAGLRSPTWQLPWMSSCSWNLVLVEMSPLQDQ